MVSGSRMPSAPQPSSFSRNLLQAIVTTTIWIALLFISAGTIHWLRGWICVAAFIASMIITTIVVKLKNPAIIAARGDWRKPGTEPFDKIFLSIYLPLTIIQPTAAGVELQRLGHPGMPLATLYLGLALLALAMVPVTWVMM